MGVETIRFSDGVTWTLNQLFEDYLAQSSTAANDTVLGFLDVDDTIDGGYGDDILYGFSGNDTLLGGVGSDELFGDEGNDRIEGGAGDDGLIGGLGDDTFVFRAGSGHDWLSDFEAGASSDDVLEFAS